MEKQFINPETLVSFPKAFTQVVAVKTGEVKTVYVSGQVAIDKQGNVVGKADLAAQAQQVFQNLALALQSAGAAPEDVVKLNVYVVDMKPEDGRTVGRARRQFFTQQDLPASTMVGVQSLVMPELLLEAEATAVVG